MSTDPNQKFIEESKDYRGWDLASESYHIGDHTWKVNRDCKKPAKQEIIQRLSDEIADTSEKLKNDAITAKTALLTSRKCNKEILEMTLIGFNYDNEAEEFGHNALGEVSKIMQALFLIFGSMEEMILRSKELMIENKLQSKLARESQSGSSGLTD